MSNNLKFTRLALKLAAQGGRAVAPNPMVGAVIVKNGRVIGKGYHQKFGGSHAEVNAIRSVKNKKDLIGSTLYVTLEPCRHYGKTPPCFDLIRRVGIERIVCGSRDPFQKSRITMKFLKGPIAQKCRLLNKFFFTWITKRRPYVTVKIAMSADNFVAGIGGKSIRLTTKKQNQFVHQLRAQHQTIMVGINTVLNDDPALTVRYAKGPDPLRVILDSDLRILRTARVLKNSNHLVATLKKRAPKGIRIWTSPGRQINLKLLFRHLAGIGISSVLIEPGPTLYRSLKKQNLIDELIVLRSQKRLKKGLQLTV